MYGNPLSEAMASHFPLPHSEPEECQFLLPLPCAALDIGPFVFWLVEDADYPAPLADIHTNAVEISEKIIGRDIHSVDDCPFCSCSGEVAGLVTPPLSLMGETIHPKHDA